MQANDASGCTNGNHYHHSTADDANGENKPLSDELNTSETSSARQPSEFSEITLSDRDQQQVKPTESHGINTISSSTQINTGAEKSTSSSAHQSKLPEYPSQNPDMLLKAANVSITEKLEKALTSVAPFLKGL